MQSIGVRLQHEGCEVVPAGLTQGILGNLLRRTRLCGGASVGSGLPNECICIAVCNRDIREQQAILQDTQDVRPVTGRGDWVGSGDSRAVGLKGGGHPSRRMHSCSMRMPACSQYQACPARIIDTHASRPCSRGSVHPAAEGAGAVSTYTHCDKACFRDHEV